MQSRVRGPDLAQPREPGMGGFRERALNVKVKHRFRRAGCLFRQSAPCPLATARGTVSDTPVSDEIHIGVRGIRGPMSAEILQEDIPVRGQTMPFEITHGEREAVIDADDGSNAGFEFRDQPLGQASARPVFPWAGWRLDLDRCPIVSGFIDPEAFQAGFSRLSSRIVYADRPAKHATFASHSKLA